MHKGLWRLLANFNFIIKTKFFRFITTQIILIMTNKNFKQKFLLIIMRTAPIPSLAQVFRRMTCVYHAASFLTGDDE